MTIKLSEDKIGGKEKVYTSICVEYKYFDEFVEKHCDEHSNAICLSSILLPDLNVMNRYYFKIAFVEKLEDYKPDSIQYKANYVWILKEYFNQTEAQIVIDDIKGVKENWK